MTRTTATSENRTVAETATLQQIPCTDDLVYLRVQSPGSVADYSCFGNPKANASCVQRRRPGSDDHPDTLVRFTCSVVSYNYPNINSESRMRAETAILAVTTMRVLYILYENGQLKTQFASVSCNARKALGIPGNLWKSLDIHDNLWKSREINRYPGKNRNP